MEKQKAKVKAELHQGSGLNPLLFSLSMDKLTDVIRCIGVSNIDFDSRKGASSEILKINVFCITRDEVRWGPNLAKPLRFMSVSVTLLIKRAPKATLSCR